MEEMNRDSQGAYGAFARVYDLFMREVDYDAWCDYLVGFCAAPGDAKPVRVLDAACGTGNLTIRFAQKGYAVTGSDASESMLEVAGEKGRMAGLKIPWVRQSLQRIALHRQSDAVNCAMDGVNYLTNAAQLDQFLQSAFAALRPGGILLFDVSTPYKLQHILSDRTFAEDEERAAYIWQNVYDTDEKLCYMLLTLFIRQGTIYVREVERHVQRGWSLQELLGALGRAGFVGATAYDFGTRRFASDTAERWQFVATRAESGLRRD